MSEKYKIGESRQPHFITITVIDWVDLFTRKVHMDLIIDSLNFCIKNKGLVIFGYCIMPSHIHLIAKSDKVYLNEIIRDFKKYTSKSLVMSIRNESESRRQWLLGKFSYAAKRIRRGVEYKVWKDGFHPVELSTNKMIDQKLDYIHQNPVVCGFVRCPDDWVYSSTGFYGGEKDDKIELQRLY